MMINARWMRGGTSKCWVFESADLEATGFSADSVLPRVFGSPDPRQLDGVGGATSTTSKALILNRDEREGIDVSFTFAQVGIEEARVDWGSNCGNCSSAVGLYAIEQGWVPSESEYTEVRTFNTNTGQMIIQTIPTPGGRLAEDPQDLIPGSVFPGHNVSLGFLSPEGRTTGVLLPTGSPVTELEMDGYNRVRVSLVDAGAPLVMVEAESIGFDIENYNEWVMQASSQLEYLDTVRRRAAAVMGLVSRPAEAERAIPKLGLVSGSPNDEADLQVLMLSMGKPHPAMPITGSVGVTVAAHTPGTVVAESMKSTIGHELRIRIPVGVLSTFTEESSLGRIVGVHRTARTLADARLPIAREQLQSASIAENRKVAL